MNLQNLVKIIYEILYKGVVENLTNS